MARLDSNQLFVGFLLIVQLLFIILFGCFGEYSDDAKPEHAHGKNGANATEARENLAKFYPMFQDVHVMIYIGFGFLMTFLKKYGYSAVSVNLLIAALSVQWHTILHGFLNMEPGDTKFHISLEHLILGEFCAGAILISMGAVLGKINPLQYCVMSFLETAFFTFNECAFAKLAVNDVGGSINLHTFGAYFGLIVAKLHYSSRAHGNPNEGSEYHSDIFSMIGTIFLWLFWPSFNAAIVYPDDAKIRAVINTYFSLASCTLVSMAFSALVTRTRKLDMVHIQNATLAGGVAIGAAANLLVTPFGSTIIGALAGFISVMGYRYIQPWLAHKLRLHDTCGVHNLHGMPGLLGSIVSVIVVAAVPATKYGDSFPLIFLAADIDSHYPHPARSPALQAAYQAAGIGTTLAFAIIGGLITGAIMKLPFCKTDKKRPLFDDAVYFNVPDIEVLTYNNGSETMESPDRQAMLISPAKH